jgi:RNA polymerase sigma-70 factor (ECF subfamily)
VPANPGAWITTAARRRAIDRLRRDRSLADRAERLAELRAWTPSTRRPATTRDRDRRRPAAADLHLLPPGARAAGAGGADAAHARRPDHRRDRARVPGRRADDGQRIVRAKRKIADARHPLPRAADDEELPDRLRGVLRSST